MISLAVESWDTYYADAALPGLWAEHFAELGPQQGYSAPAPDVPYFKALDSMGMLQIVVARKRGVMIGYSLMVVKRHPHYTVLCGFEDAYFLASAERKGMAGVRLLLSTLHHLRKRGAKKAFFMTKKLADMSRLFKRLGFEHTDEVFSLWLEA